jgi:hypothetical protein
MLWKNNSALKELKYFYQNKFNYEMLPHIGNKQSYIH